jgi:5-methylcytosine-specific restriction endonuclease McrA
MNKTIHLPPASGITGKSTNIYKEYAVLRKHSQDFRIWLSRQYARQDARCFYCRVSLRAKRINVEHVLPMSRGGDNRSHNLVLACADCNKAKGSTVLTKAYLQRQHKKVKKQWRRSAVRYNYELKVQSEIAESLSWIT